MRRVYRWLVVSMLLTLLLTFTGTSYAVGHDTYYEYFADGTFTGNLVGEHDDYCDGSTYDWGTPSYFRLMVVTSCGGSPTWFWHCQAYVNGSWQNVNCT